MFSKTDDPIESSRFYLNYSEVDKSFMETRLITFLQAQYNHVSHEKILAFRFFL